MVTVGRTMVRDLEDGESSGRERESGQMWCWMWVADGGGGGGRMVTVVV